eukprot:COSAG04_NODE_1753_length_5696_cov_19.164195_1_plen_41_part_10
MDGVGLADETVKAVQALGEEHSFAVNFGSSEDLSFTACHPD